jgi:hypothetical protein
VALRNALKRLRTPVSDLDQERLRQFCSSLPGVRPIDSLEPREDATVVGEVTSLRIVPRAGSSSLEVTISDGTGSIVAMWTGRRRMAGVGPGKRLVISGRGSPTGSGGRLVIVNPRYELL